EFIYKNYKDLKTLNPKLPILIRECRGVEPQLWARYGEHAFIIMIQHHVIVITFFLTASFNSLSRLLVFNWFLIAFNLTSLVTLPDMGVERCIRLDGLTEADINKKLEELAKAAGALKH
ncbi:unnamed protein product, partial [Musa textilis]